MSVAALVVAAGRGTRAGSDVPKQYVDLGGVTALGLSVTRFLALEAVEHVLVVIHGEDHARYAAAMAGLGDPRLVPPVTGGADRAGSVLNGLEALVAAGPGKVLIHDAARPFVPLAVIRAVIDALDTADGATAGLPVVDALWRTDAGTALCPQSRDGVWRAQTPQGFRFDAILEAHRAHKGQATDDVAVAQAAGLTVRFVEGAEAGYKITTQADLARARRDVAQGNA